jgi:hypothetical protein
VLGTLLVVLNLWELLPDVCGISVRTSIFYRIRYTTVQRNSIMTVNESTVKLWIILPSAAHHCCWVTSESRDSSTWTQFPRDRVTHNARTHARTHARTRGSFPVGPVNLVNPCHLPTLRAFPPPLFRLCEMDSVVLLRDFRIVTGVDELFWIFCRYFK